MVKHPSLVLSCLFLAGIGGVWYLAEYRLDTIPLAVRSFCANIVAGVRGIDAEPAQMAEDEPTLEVEVQEATPRQASAKKAGNLVAALPAVRACGVSAARWAIVSESVSFCDPNDGRTLGKASLGAMVTVKSSRRGEHGRGIEILGEFRGHPEQGTVVLPASKLYCFTGQFESLPADKQEAVIAYYKTKAKLVTHQIELEHKMAERSPYFEAAVAAKKKFDTLAEEAKRVVEKAKRTSGKEQADLLMRQGALKGDLAVARDRLKELSEKHKQWKTEHVAGFVVEDDEEALQLRKQMETWKSLAPSICR